MQSQSISQSPFHRGDKPNEREASPCSSLHDLLEQSQGLVLIESAVAKMHVRPSAQFELPGLADSGYIDARVR